MLKAVLPLKTLDFLLALRFDQYCSRNLSRVNDFYVCGPFDILEKYSITGVSSPIKPLEFLVVTTVFFSNFDFKMWFTSMFCIYICTLQCHLYVPALLFILPKGVQSF